MCDAADKRTRVVHLSSGVRNLKKEKKPEKTQSGHKGPSPKNDEESRQEDADGDDEMDA